MNLSPLPIQKFFDNAGVPLSGGKLFTYAAATTTKIATYQDQAGTLNANPVVLNFRGEANVWLDQTLTYKFVLAPANDTDPPTNPIWTVDNISAAVTYASLTQQIIGQILFPRTAGEIAVPLVPSNYGYRAEPIAEAERYGLSTANSAAANTTALNAAISALPFFLGSIRGGTVLLPPGTFNINEIIVPPYTRIQGAGLRCTYLAYSGTDVCISLGSAVANNTLKRGSAVSDLSIQCLATAGSGVRIQECAEAEISRVYIEGYTASVIPRTNIGIIVDGGTGTAGCFCNYINDVFCNHVNVGLRFLTTGGQRSTATFIKNLSVLGDDSVYGASRGWIIDSGQGDGSYWSGGNIEHCNIGVAPAANSLSFTMSGTRFEGNATDIISGGGTQQNSTFLGINSELEYNVSDANQLYTFIGCTTTSIGPWVNRLSASLKGPRKDLLYGATVTADIQLSNEFNVNVTNATAFAIAAPTHIASSDGQLLRLMIRNTSGGAMGVITWNAVFKMSAWTNPANGFSRSIQFRYDGANWVEVTRTTVDVPN